MSKLTNSKGTHKFFCAREHASTYIYTDESFNISFENKMRNKHQIRQFF